MGTTMYVCKKVKEIRRNHKISMLTPAKCIFAVMNDCTVSLSKGPMLLVLKAHMQSWAPVTVFLRTEDSCLGWPSLKRGFGGCRCPGDCAGQSHEEPVPLSQPWEEHQRCPEGKPKTCSWQRGGAARSGLSVFSFSTQDVKKIITETLFGNKNRGSKFEFPRLLIVHCSSLIRPNVKQMWWVHIRWSINIFCCWNIYSFSLNKYIDIMSYDEHITGKINQIFRLLT